MKIAYVHGGREVPTVRFRSRFIEPITERGHSIDQYASHPGRYAGWKFCGWRLSQWLKRMSRRIDFQRIRKKNYDSVVLETNLFHLPGDQYEQLLRRAASYLVYEIDDAVFLLFPEKIASIARMADHVIVGNKAIADWIQDYNPSISIIPTCIDGSQYPSKWDSHVSLSKEPSEASKPVLGWVGSSGNVQNLNLLGESLEAVNQTTAFELRIVTSRDAIDAVDQIRSRSKFPVTWVDIDQCSLSEQLFAFDIAIMPLPDDEWSQYKCNAKVIQYMASGLPTIASDVGFNRTLIEHGTNGLLARDDGQWQAAIASLANDQSLQRKLGAAARELILNRYTVESQFDEYLSAILPR